VLTAAPGAMGYHIHCLYDYGPGKLLVGCDDGIIELNTHDGKWEKINSGHTIRDRFVYSVMRDKEGGLWYGTFYNGVTYIPPISERFETYGNDEQPTMGNIVSCFCEDSKGNIWVATDDGGMECYNPVTKSFVNFPARERLQKMNIHALYSEGDNLWIGTYTDGIMKMNTSNWNIKRYPYDQGKPESSCYALYKDKQGTLWAGTMSGMCVYDESNDSFRVVKPLYTVVIDIIEDNSGNLWFATQGDGLWKYSRNSKQWKNYKHDDSENSLSDNQINSLCIDSDNQLYVATSNGLCVYNSQKDNFTRQKIEAPSNDICCVISDDGCLWISTANGLVKYIKGETTQVFNQYDGLASGQFRNNAGLKASDGKLYFGSVNGFCTFYPYQIKANNRAPAVYITGIELYNKPVETGSEKLPLSLSAIKQLELSSSDNMLGISFAALSYCSPQKNQYAYMLEGFDKDWIYTGNNNHATYTNLPAGTYTFKVKATNNDGLWSNKEATLKIVVHPPFWWSWPAKLLYLCLLALGIYFYTHLKLKRADHRHKKEIQRLNQQRESEEKEARLKFFTMVAHEIRTPVSLIIGPLESVMTKLQNTDEGKTVDKDLNIIERNANRLLDLVNQLLDFNKVKHDAVSVHFAPHNIGKIMQAVAERFEPTLKQKNATLTVKYPPQDFTATVDGEGLTKIISNLMSNANKYTKDKVALSCETGKDTFTISVEDNGQGISKEEQKKIFDEFYQAKDNKPGTGIGLNIVKSLVGKHNGKVTIESELQKGSIFKVTLPINQDVQIGEAKEDITQEETVQEETSMAAVETPALSDAVDSVLIVEDDDDMRNFLSANFSDKYTVYTASNGKEGLQALQSHQVTLIVSDWMMPEMDGAEFCKAVRKDANTSHIPFVLLTAKTDDASKTQGMDCGADAYIEKPFSMKYLEACIRNIIEMRKLLMSKFSTHADLPLTSIAKTEVDNTLLTQMSKIIEDNIDSPELSVNFLAEQLGVSRSGLFAKIKALADVTPNEMIQVVRLKKAAELMTQNKYRVNEICYMVGFSSPSYFTKCFQKQFGMRPAEYIAQNKE